MTNANDMTSTITLAAAQMKPMNWLAQWIWQKDVGPDNAWMAFRKTVTLKDVPAKVVANIAADSKFWLWINGELVRFEGGSARGPSRNAAWTRDKELYKDTWDAPPETKPTNTWVDEVDISGFLKPGENQIAILVWYWGRETHKGTHIDSGKGGLLFQADVGAQRLVSDDSWKVKLHPSYALDSGAPDKNIVQSKVKYDARNDLDNGSLNAWTNANFDDKAWDKATPKGTPPTAPWFNLEKNYVPALVNHGLQNYENYPATAFPFVSDGAVISAQLPFNQQITPYFEIEGEAGQVIEVGTDNRLNKITANYTTKAGEQKFECLAWMNGHSVKYQIPLGVKVVALKYRWMSVGDMPGSFECNDPFYQRLWWMGRNTLWVCARDNFMDCPDRERALWIGDVADQSSYLFYAMDESGRQLLKKAIYTTLNFSENDVYGALGPLRIRELPSQSLQFIPQGIWQYYWNTGDLETLKFAYPHVHKYLALWEMEAGGLPKYRKWASPDNWDWVDWGDEKTIDKTAIQFALYYMALQSARQMAEAVGNTSHVGWYDERIASIKSAYNKQLWTGKFYSSTPDEWQDDRANALAILSGLADADKSKTIVENVLIPNLYCSPHFEWMVEDAMCQAGFPREALARMKTRYQSQVDRTEITTLYENFPAGGTYNHAWNAPNAILSKRIAGIAPTKVGWSEFEVAPHLVDMTAVKQIVPSVRGNIVADIRRTANSYELDLTAPTQTTAIVGIPKTLGKIGQIKVNGVTVWSNGAFVKDARSITPLDEDAEFVKFKVPAGEWKVVASVG